jgi:hypothetical protein
MTGLAESDRTAIAAEHPAAPALLANLTVSDVRTGRASGPDTSNHGHITKADAYAIPRTTASG